MAMAAHWGHPYMVQCHYALTGMNINMKIFRRILLLAVTCLPFNSFAADKYIICEEPIGSRVDYFVSNTADLKNETFLMGRDRVTGLKPRIRLNDQDQNVFFVIGDAEELKSKEKSAEMRVFAYNEDQITFAGLVNGAPILATYYPGMKILIYSQQSTWPGPEFEGARAMLFYSKCDIDQSAPVAVSLPAGLSEHK